MLAMTELKSTIDDEYSNAGIENPKILLTTSRDPSSRLTQFVKVLLLHLGNDILFLMGNQNYLPCALLVSIICQVLI